MSADSKLLSLDRGLGLRFVSYLGGGGRAKGLGRSQSVPCVQKPGVIFVLFLKRLVYVQGIRHPVECEGDSYSLSLDPCLEKAACLTLWVSTFADYFIGEL